MFRFWRPVILAAGVAVLAALVAAEGGAVVAHMLWQIGWGFLALVLLRAGYVALRAAALWRTMPDGGVSYRELWWIRLSTEAVEMITLTGPWLAEPAKGWLLTRRGLPPARAIGCVALEFVLYLIVTAWMAAIALWMLVGRSSAPSAWRLPAFFVIGGIAIATIGVAYAAARRTLLLTPLVRRAGNLLSNDRGIRAARAIEQGESAVLAFLHGHGIEFMRVVALQVAAQVLLATEVWIVFRALGLHTTLLDSFVFEGAVKLIDLAFFFVPGQLGAHEGLYSVVAGGLGIVPAAGLTLSLARRIRGVLVGLTAAFGRLAPARALRPL